MFGINTRALKLCPGAQTDKRKVTDVLPDLDRLKKLTSQWYTKVVSFDSDEVSRSRVTEKEKGRIRKHPQRDHERIMTPNNSATSEKVCMDLPCAKPYTSLADPFPPLQCYYVLAMPAERRGFEAE